MGGLTAGDGLLQAILDEPDANDLRLIYADWLEDHGEEEQAEFIRVQVGGGVAALPLSVFSPVADLLLGVGIDFRGEVDNGYGGSRWESEDGAVVLWRRGFVHAVRCPLETWLQHGRDIVRRHPIQQVEATDRVAGCFGACDLWELHYTWWIERDAEGDPARLPDEIHDLLGDADFDIGSFMRGKNYYTIEAANDALSHALLTWAKQI